MKGKKIREKNMTLFVLHFQSRCSFYLTRKKRYILLGLVLPTYQEKPQKGLKSIAKLKEAMKWIRKRLTTVLLMPSLKRVYMSK